MRLRYARTQTGSIIVLQIAIAFFIILPLALLGFEMARFYLLESQLEHVAGACALAGTGSIATIPTGSGAPTGNALQQLYNGCAQESIYCAQLNSLIGSNLATELPAGNIYLNPGINANGSVTVSAPADGKVAIAINFLNQDNSWHQDLTTSGAVKMRVDLAYTTHPIFEGLVSLHVMPLETAFASAVGGLPQLDVFLCFDVSGSMDDQTNVAFLRRFWDTSLPNGGGVNYQIIPGYQGTHLNGVANGQGTIFNMEGCGLAQDLVTGSGLNVCPPQGLAYSGHNPQAATPWFYAQLRSNGAGGSSPPEAGQLPGNVTVVGTVPTPVAGFNLDPYGAGGWHSFTDLVYVPSNANMTTVVTEVEASRGNLTSLAVLNQSLGGASYAAHNPYYNALQAAVNSNSYTSYWLGAYQHATPSYQAVQAASNFIATMNLSTDARFGLCCFSTNAASSTSQVFPTGGQDYLIDPSYLNGGAPSGGTFPLPFVSLSAGTNSYTQAFNSLAVPSSYNPLTNTASVTATGETDIYDALNNAFQDIRTNSRATAKKAVVLFTDGVPTYPPNSTQTIPNNSNTDILNLVNSNVGPGAANIPVYCIGLAQNANPQLMAEENTLLSGIVTDSGHTGQYIATTSSSQLDQAFQTIARGLVLLTGQ